MLVLRHLTTVSVGAVMALAWGIATTAQSVPPSPPQNASQPLPKTTSPVVKTQKTDSALSVSSSPTASPQPETEKTGKVLPAPQNGEVSQSPSSPPNSVPAPSSTETSPKQPSAPNNLNPNANPLLFPTKPSEVEIKNSQAITLVQAIELALRNNKDLQLARLTLERSRAALKDARAALYPTLNTTVQFNQTSSASADISNQEIEKSNAQRRVQQGELAFQQETNPTESTNVQGSVGLNYNIYTGERRSATIARAERQIRFDQLQIEKIAEDTRFNATRDYYDLQNADAQVAIAQAAVEDTSQTLRDARLLEQAGLGTRFDVLRAEVDLARANQGLTRAIADQRTARRRLAQTLSVAQNAELTAADEIREAGTWPFSLDESIVQAYKNRSELEQQLVQKEISQKDSLIALADIKPQVSFFANYNFLDNFNDIVGVGNGYEVGAQMQWTFFDGGSAFARAEQAYRNMDIADTTFAQQRDAIRQQVESSYFDLTANQENIGSTRKNVERAEESLRLARLRFQAGVGTQTDVINAQRDLTDARSQYLQAIIGYNQSLNALQRSVSNLPNNRLFELR